MLRERILNQLEAIDMGQRQLAKVANVSESTISRYLNGRDELKFESTLKIVQHLFPDQEQEYIAEYAVTQKSYNARCCLEYCLIHHLWELNDQIIPKLMASSNPMDREWAKVYEYVLSYHRRELPDDELLDELMKFHPNTFEVGIMRNLVIGYVYFFQKKFDLLMEYIKGIDQKISEVKSTFMQSCLATRYGLIMMHVYMFKNNIEETRKLSRLVIKQSLTDNGRASAYHVLGHSYLFEDYNQAYEYLSISISLFKKANSKANYIEAFYTLSFTQSYWQIEREFPFDLTSYKEIDEYIFYLIQKGETPIAKEICKKIQADELEEWDKAFYYYYLGLIEDNKTYLYESVRYFRKAQDRFHLQLPIIALKNKNENETLLQIFNE